MILSDYTQQENNRIQRFLGEDVQFDLKWAEFLCDQSKKALADKTHFWEGAANASLIRIQASGVVIEPLHEQYPDNILLPHSIFIALLEGWITSLKSDGK